MIHELEQKRAELVAQIDNLWEAAGSKKGDDGVSRPNFSQDQYEKYQKMVAELDGIVPQIEAFRRGEEYRKKERVGNRPDLGGTEPQAKDLISAVQSVQGGLRKNMETEIKFDPRASVGVKATMTTAAGFTPAVRRDGVVVPLASIRPALLDYMRVIPWDRDAYYFMRQTTRTNAAAPKNQGAAVDEATSVYTQISVALQKIGVFLPVTDEQLGDEQGIRAIVEDDLLLMVRQVLTTQVISGDGTAPNLRGLMNLSGVQTQAKGGDTVFDAIRKAITKSTIAASGSGGRATPNVLVLHPNDWQDIQLERDATGRYLMGDPGQAGMRTIWGLNVVEEESATENTGIVIDTNMVPLILRQQAEIAVSDSHSDYFTKNIQAIRCTMRAALASYRDASVVTVTGI